MVLGYANQRHDIWWRKDQYPYCWFWRYWSLRRGPESRYKDLHVSYLNCQCLHLQLGWIYRLDCTSKLELSRQLDQKYTVEHAGDWRRGSWGIGKVLSDFLLGCKGLFASTYQLGRRDFDSQGLPGEGFGPTKGVLWWCGGKEQN